MRFATIRHDGREQAAIAVHEGSWAPLDALDPALGGDLLTLIEAGWSDDRLATLAQDAGRLPATALVVGADAVFAPPYRRPHKIWGIGLNYADHARDLSESAPDQPASFIKGDHTIIGPGDDIVLPRQSQRVTVEAELGLVVGRLARDVSEDAALAQLFGVCAVLDQTAEDILQLNPRYLTRAKNFPSFFSFGPEVVTLDEALGGGPLEDLEVATVVDGVVHRSAAIALMTHPPARLVSFHSAIMPLHPGDVISTGTPGAKPVSAGMVAEARVGSLAPLRNPVIDQPPPEPQPPADVRG